MIGLLDLIQENFHAYVHASFVMVLLRSAWDYKSVYGYHHVLGGNRRSGDGYLKVPRRPHAAWALGLSVLAGQYALSLAFGCLL